VSFRVLPERILVFNKPQEQTIIRAIHLGIYPGQFKLLLVALSKNM